MFRFQQLHRQDASNFDVFHRTVMPQVELCLAGFNTCLLLIGESGSGKSYTIAGETMSKSGIVPLSMDHIFAKIGEGNCPSKHKALTQHWVIDGLASQSAGQH